LSGDDAKKRRTGPVRDIEDENAGTAGAAGGLTRIGTLMHKGVEVVRRPAEQFPIPAQLVRFGE